MARRSVIAQRLSAHGSEYDDDDEELLEESALGDFDAERLQMRHDEGRGDAVVEQRRACGGAKVRGEVGVQGGGSWGLWGGAGVRAGAGVIGLGLKKERRVESRSRAVGERQLQPQ